MCILTGDAEHTHRTNIVGWRSQIDDEGFWEQVKPFLIRPGLTVDKDIGKRCGCIAYIGYFCKAVQYPTDAAVDSRWVIFQVGLAFFVKCLHRSINGGIVRLIVNQQQRQFADILASRF